METHGPFHWETPSQTHEEVFRDTQRKTSVGILVFAMCEVLTTHKFPLFDERTAPRVRIRPHEAPVVHVVYGMGERLPFATAPVLCLSDWQWEPSTQSYFWSRALEVLEGVCGCEELRRALVLVAGDMASSKDDLRGVASDDEPKLGTFASFLGSEGVFHFVYGNHDNEVPPERQPVNASGAPTLLPDGKVVQSMWSAAPSLTVGGVHGIPGQPNGWKKRARGEYFPRLEAVCSEAQVVMVHCNPKLPFQQMEGHDQPKIFEAFSRGRARLLVHGHHHMPEVVTVLPDGKVVVNSDSRVVLLVGRPAPEEAPETPAFDPKAGIKLQRKLREILALEQKLADGDCLTADQRRKLEGKAICERRLLELQASASDGDCLSSCPVSQVEPQSATVSSTRIKAFSAEARSARNLQNGADGSLVAAGSDRSEERCAGEGLAGDLLQEPRDVTSRAPRRWERRAARENMKCSFNPSNNPIQELWS